jgi:hypothetical protein
MLTEKEKKQQSSTFASPYQSGEKYSSHSPKIAKHLNSIQILQRSLGNQYLNSLPIEDSTNVIQRRTLGVAGACWFQNCDNQLDNFFMIPEDGPPGFHPSGSSPFRVDDVDGFWFKFHTPKDEWFKIPDIGTGQVTCNDEDEENPNISSPVIPFATAYWTNDRIHTPNPF